MTRAEFTLLCKCAHEIGLTIVRDPLGCFRLVEIAGDDAPYIVSRNPFEVAAKIGEIRALDGANRLPY